MPKIVTVALASLAIALIAATFQSPQSALGAVAIADPDPSSLSIDGIMLGIDVKSLPVQEIEDRSLVFTGAPDE